MGTFRRIAVVALLLFAGFAVAPSMAMAYEKGQTYSPPPPPSAPTISTKLIIDTDCEIDVPAIVIPSVN